MFQTEFHTINEKQSVSVVLGLLFLRVFFAGIFFIAVGCTPNTTKKHYIIAEKLWSKAQYDAAVVEFEKVFQLDSKGALGRQALYRAAMTQALFLNQNREALEKLAVFIQQAESAEEKTTAEKQIAEIQYENLKNYPAAIEQYQRMMSGSYTNAEKAEFNYRISRAQFHLHQYKEAIQTLEELQKNFPTSAQREQAAFDIGMIYFTYGDQQSIEEMPGAEEDSRLYLRSQMAFEGFIKEFPNSKLVPQAWFGIANSLEEMDKLDQAAEIYDKIQKTYPSPNVIEIKRVRLRERLAKRNK